MASNFNLCIHGCCTSSVFSRICKKDKEFQHYSQNLVWKGERRRIAWYYHDDEIPRIVNSVTAFVTGLTRQGKEIVDIGHFVLNIGARIAMYKYLVFPKSAIFQYKNRKDWDFLPSKLPSVAVRHFYESSKIIVEELGLEDVEFLFLMHGMNENKPLSQQEPHCQLLGLSKDGSSRIIDPNYETESDPARPINTARHMLFHKFRRKTNVSTELWLAHYKNHHNQCMQLCLYIAYCLCTAKPIRTLKLTRKLKVYNKR
jgi:hypothetical protein